MATVPPKNVRRARTIARVIGATLGFVGGILYGGFVLSNAPGVLGTSNAEVRAALLLFAGAGSASFALAAPLVSVDAFLWVTEFADTAPAAEVFGAVLGLLVALAIAAMVAILLGGLPFGIGFITSVTLALALGFIGIRTGRRRRHAFVATFRGRAGEERVLDSEPERQDGAPIVVDTSVLIDGRVVDVASTGFIQGRLIIPSFVLEELQRVADSADAIRRGRGRRGLAAVETLKQSHAVVVEILELDFPGTPEVDARLIKLARLRNAGIITQDYNLNRLAQIEGLRVLNLNDLANALKPIAATGDVITVTVVKDGREPNQGIGYLEDGTMVVVEGGRNKTDQTVSAVVSSVLQTAAGRMIFAQLQVTDERTERGGRRGGRGSGAGGDDSLSAAEPR